MSKLFGLYEYYETPSGVIFPHFTTDGEGNLVDLNVESRTGDHSCGIFCQRSKTQGDTLELTRQLTLKGETTGKIYGIIKIPFPPVIWKNKKWKFMESCAEHSRMQVEESCD